MGSLQDVSRKGNRGKDEGEKVEEEPILKQQNQRFCMFPIKYQPLW
ncbi:hypothetical protein SLEP1_g50724 [Rubroshorea leprosula]|uniref:Uncharacterized protein n=1 Tax=Rubroshorea leprosula TaxID=152421 RepID=A0AAV5M3I3_9ROSI|nr:hypothetical protein SLEP1_g50724 [Rubroshorea leprosula]